MKKVLFTLAAISMIALFSSCAATKIFTPREYGNATGVSIYLGYSRVSQKQDEKFKQAAAELWKTVQAIETYEDLAKSVDKITALFDTCIKTDKLSPEEKMLCVMLRKKIADKVGQVLANKVEKSEDAKEFLLGVREGIAEMIAIGQ